MTSRKPRVDSLEPVWKALANQWRREILDHLRDGPMTTGELAESFPDLSRFAVMQHLKVLEEAGLVVVRRSGRSRINHLNPVPIQQIYERWVRQYEGRWTEALVSLKRQIERSRETHLPGSHSSTAS